MKAPVSWNERAATLLHAALASAQRAHRAPLARDVARLHGLFTHERSDRAAGYLREPALRRAYLGYFAPLNAVKVARLLVALQEERALALPDAPSVLDLGAGPLSGIAGAWIALGRLGPSVAVDLAEKAMADGRRLLEEAGALSDIASLELRTRSVTQSWAAPRDRADLVVLANVLNEIGDPRRDLDKRVRVVESALERLSEGGRVLIVEPGTRVHGRALQALRDRLVASERASVLAPCFGAARCPLLERSSDWCHHELPWDPPEELAALERAAGLEKTTLKLSYLVLAPPGQVAAEGMRLVGGTMRAGAPADVTERRYACGRGGLVVLRGRKGRLPAAVSRPLRGARLDEVPEGAVVEEGRGEAQPSRPRGPGSTPRSRSRRGRGSGAR